MGAERLAEQPLRDPYQHHDAAMRTRHTRKLISSALGLIVLGSLLFCFAPAQLGGSASYVITHGTSMEPHFHTGDLAIVRARSSYRVGEVVAYDNKMLHTIVLHRIIGRSGSRYIFKGDNNNFVDYEHPAASQLMGALWLHIPGAGATLESIRSPVLTGLLVAAGMLLFTGAAFTRRRRRRRRQALGADGFEPQLRRVPRRPAEPMVGALAIGVLALVPFVTLALLAFTRPTSALRPFTIPYKQTGAFSYSAAATPGPAYPGNHVVTGEPLFTHVLDKVSMRFAYRFTTAAKHSITGKASLVATLTSSSGWHTTVPLGAPTYFRGDHGSVAASVDLQALIALMHDVQRTTQVSGTYTLTITPHVSTTASLDLIPLHTTFSPPLHFSLNELEAEPSEGGASGAASAKTPQFSPSVSGSAPGKHYEPLYLSFKLARTTVASARAIALGGIAVVLFAVLAALALVRPRQRDETASILSRYGRLIVPVARVWQLPGVAVIDVADIDALARIAEHYDRSILHEQTVDGDAFWVTDESGHFRYALQPAATSTVREPYAPAWTGEQEPVSGASGQNGTADAWVTTAWAESPTTEMPAVAASTPSFDAPAQAWAQNGAAEPAGEPAWAHNGAAEAAGEPAWSQNGADEPAIEAAWSENGAAERVMEPVWTTEPVWSEYGAGEQAGESLWAENREAAAWPVEGETIQSSEPYAPVERETIQASESDALANQVYADELQLGGVFTASGAQPAPLESAVPQQPEPQPWPPPEEAPTFVQEPGAARAPGESSGISRTRAGAVFVHVTGF
jgi:signal peptidase I